jgi:membrane-associated phospholipid phosphatase
LLGFSLLQPPRMPSTHSAAIMFYGTYITLACAWLPMHASLPQSPLLRPFVALVTVPWACAVAGSRILLGHHTAPQVIVGCIYGFTFAGVWFWAWTHGLSDLGQTVELHVNAYIGS